MLTIFTLAEGRSGTKFLSGVLRRNLSNCVVQHEPYFRWSNPNMFGRPIYDHCRGDMAAIRERVRRKQGGISGYSAACYIETSHAFLKSYADVAMEFFPELKLIHLIRHPAQVARSSANREALTHRYRLPFRYYRGGDGRRYYRWSLTGLEPIYQHFAGQQLTLYQRYLVQWIEIENRAMQFLGDHQKHKDCFTLLAPNDLNAPERIAEMLSFFELTPREPRIRIDGDRNRTPGRRTEIGREDNRQFREVVERLPSEHLEIFQHPPYASQAWSTLLAPSSGSP